MAAPPIEIHGKSYPMTVITPVSRSKRFIVDAVLYFFTFLKLEVVTDLRLIHFATWLPIKRNAFPRLSEEQPKEELKDDYFLFTTNFNGSWDQYIDAFGLIKGVRKGLNWLWWASRGFPGAWPMRPFKRYIHYYEYPLALYYNGYPGMSVRDIHAATELSEKLDEFIESEDEHDSASAFQEKFRRLLDEVAEHLGDTGDEGLRHEVPPVIHSRPIALQP